MSSASDPARLQRARLALEGLSLGDSFGERFFGSPFTVEARIERRSLPTAPWTYTDDTVMALSVCEVLTQTGSIDPDRLAAAFARRYERDPCRGYGGTAHEILRRIASGDAWRVVAGEAFSGMGSLGNGGAMRVAPVGAWFADDLDEAARQARRSAEVTHAHAEGQAGAVAVAVAAGWAYATRDEPRPAFEPRLLEVAIDRTPSGETRDGLARALRLARGASVTLATSALGNGTRVSAPDTVPFALWCAAHHLGDFEEAMWRTVSGLGDRDTTCAIVGGIVALSVGERGLPPSWLAAREPLAAMT